jgi:hypothetical protein
VLEREKGEAEGRRGKDNALEGMVKNYASVSGTSLVLLILIAYY